MRRFLDHAGAPVALIRPGTGASGGSGAPVGGVLVATARGWARLRELGVLAWVRRCAASMRDGRVVLEQQTNAYAVRPETQWRGYRPPQDPPGPAPGTWGDHPHLPSTLAQAAAERTLAGKVQLLGSDPGDALAAALARLGRAMEANRQ